MAEELPDSILDLPDWNEEDFRQMNSKVLDALFGHRSTQISMLPAVLQIEKIEARKKGGRPQASRGNISPYQYASLSEEEQALQDAEDERAAIEEDAEEVPVPERNPLEVVEWTNPTGQGVRIEDDKGRGTFGASRTRGDEKYLHDGQDYISTPGQDVYAITNGTVVRWPGGFDGIVVGNGRGISWKILYIDVDPSLSIGDLVKSGDVIGTAQDIIPTYGEGMTNHVHVKLKVDGGVVDPRDYIPE